MLYISTSKIRESTVGASFTVSFSVAPDEIGYLTALHEKYAEMNMCGFTIKPSDSENPNNCEDEPMKTADYCDICKRDMCEVCVAYVTNPYCVPSHYEIRYEPKTEPQTMFYPQVDGITPSVIKTEPQTETHDIRTDTHECVKTEPQTDYRIADTIGYKCPKCGRGNFLKYEANCVYCGEPLIKTDCAWGKGE